MRDLVIVGAGGHGRELFATVAAINAATPTWRILGFVDDDPQHLDRVERLGSRVLGDTAWLESNPGYYAIGIGTSAVRTTSRPGWRPLAVNPRLSCTPEPTSAWTFALARVW